jgi:predicted ArsR family transcriptional regulator
MAIKKADKDPADRQIREVTDARTMRALAHPVRLALIETLTLEGPLTATEAGERIGESPTTCSFHLRQLAKYGFVEEAGGGTGRARPWRLSAQGMRFSNEHDDPETELAAGALARLLRERNLERYRNWLETRGSYPRVWREAAETSAHMLWLTTDELKQLNQELLELLLARFTDRRTDPSARPADALPVELLMFTYPRTPPAGGTA